MMEGRPLWSPCCGPPQCANRATTRVAPTAGNLGERERAVGAIPTARRQARDSESERARLHGSARRAKLAAREGLLTTVAAMPESEEAWTLHPRQEAETPLLAVVKTLVKRRQSVRIALERGAAGGKCIGTALSALDRIFRRPIGA